MKGKGQLNWEKWIRHGEYRIEKVKNRDYIRPVPESGRIFYDINETLQREGRRKSSKNSLVELLLNLNTSDTENILKFVNRFGLMGLLQHKYLEPQSVIIDGKIRFYVPEKDGEELKDIEEIADNYLIDIIAFKRSGFYEVRNSMSEPLDEFVEAVKEFQYVGNLIYALKRAENGVGGPLRTLFIKEENLRDPAKKKETEDLVRMAKIMVMMFLVKGNGGIIRRAIYIGLGKWEFRWNFESLLSAAYFFFTQDLSGNSWIGECPRCSKLFLSYLSTKSYCSRKCEDATRKAKSRQKGGGEKNGRDD